MKIQVKKLNDDAALPVYGSSHAAGADLCALETFLLTPGSRKLYKTGLAMAIPSGVYGRIAPRSGLAFKHGIDVLAGVIDEDYRGDIGVILINHSNEDVCVNAGDKIAQIIFERYERGEFAEATVLPDTERGVGGYGSTDVKPNFSLVL